MSGTSGVGSATSSSDRATQGTEQALRRVNIDDFLKLMIAELQNQDPMNPLDNSQMLDQLSQIREIGATEHLTETINAIQLGQNLSTAGALLGKYVRGVGEDGKEIKGKVERVTVHEGAPTLHVGHKQMALSNVGEILEQAAEE